MIRLYAVLRSCDNGECDTVIEQIFANIKDAENCLIRRYMAHHMDCFEDYLYDDDGDEDIQCTDCSRSLINNLLDIYYFDIKLCLGQSFGIYVNLPFTVLFIVSLLFSVLSRTFVKLPFTLLFNI